jgi:hypothetical protein
MLVGFGSRGVGKIRFVSFIAETIAASYVKALSTTKRNVHQKLVDDD